MAVSVDVEGDRGPWLVASVRVEESRMRLADPPVATVELVRVVELREEMRPRRDPGR